ncbi:fimbrial protein [Salmonella enterica subsp. enterica serovar Mississippi]|nr:fimbrial protein [Salmonella enterica subsp. enterica serovar Mississippi]
MRYTIRLAGRVNMKSKRRPGRRVWAKLFVTGLLFIQGYAWAQECHFGQNGEGGESTIINTEVSGAPLNFARVPVQDSDGIVIAGPYEAALSPALWSECDSGNDGKQMSNIVYENSGAGVDGMTLWPTNVKGIYYAVRIYSENNAGSWFKATHSGVWSNLGVEAGNNSHGWKAQIKLVQTSDFLGNAGHITAITPQKALRIGGMAIGDRGNESSNDNDPWYFSVTPSTFSIPVTTATCQSAVVHGNGGTNRVDFGEAMFSDVANTGWYPHRDFTVQLEGCNNVVAIQYRVTSQKTDGTTSNSTLLLNTLTTDAASGVGVMINSDFASNPSNGPFINDPQWFYVDMDKAGTGVTNDKLKFQAYFRKQEGAVLKPGNFEAVATFEINYL